MTPKDKQLIEDIFENDEPMGEVDTYHEPSIEEVNYAFLMYTVQDMVKDGALAAPGQKSFMAPPNNVSFLQH